MQCSVCQMKALIEIVAQGKVFGRDKWMYHYCLSCEFVFLNPSERLTAVDEKNRYLAHTNNHGDQGFADFLAGFVRPVDEILRGLAFRKGLDFGSGPEPVLAEKFRDKGYLMSLYDPFFATGEDVLKDQYDFVVCHEVIEHCFDPMRDLKTMLGCLRPGGVLAIRTQVHPGPKLFENWHYRRDPTHVSFFQSKTFAVIAERLNLRTLRAEKDIFVFAKG